MSSRRRTTVHDLAALRLHPDGSRVPNSQNNLQGNWIAQDAGGLGTVKKRRSAHKDQDIEEGESFDLAGGDDEIGESSQRRHDEVVDEALEGNTRGRKRRRFHDDLGFLEAPQIIPQPIRAHHPPYDLLKCLHHFASAYYGAMGQLYDASKEARRTKRLRRLKRLRRQANAGDDEREKHEGSGKEDDSGQETVSSEKIKTRERHWTAKASKTDMYKIFDGSALMAIGMLVQEHIEGLLAANIPAGWEAATTTDEAEPDQGEKPPRHKKTRKGKQAVSHSADIEEEAEDRDTTDSEEVGDGPRDRRATRGVGVSGPSPFIDDDSADEDFVP
ncbi:hypothetical protein B0H21DRAFT_780007 [Amylocystis lapponica]|nr:hypothetical protein B0H21DRAFT_780007 [Amylocystis lapponica]